MEKFNRMRQFFKLNIFFVSSCLFCYHSFSQGSWTEQKGLMIEPDPRAFASSFTIRYDGYMVAGTDSRPYSSEFWQVKQPFDVWSQKADFPGEKRIRGVGLTIGNKGYFGTGVGQDAMKDFWEYDPEINRWTRKADFPGGKRSAATAFTIGGKGYVGTGFYGGYFADLWEYDPSIDNWRAVAAIPLGRAGAVSFTLNNKGYVGTGATDEQLKDFWEYDPLANSWRRIADFGGAPRHDAVAFTQDYRNLGYVGTGYLTSDLSGPVSKDFWQYDAIANNWSQVADLPGEARAGAISFNSQSSGPRVGSGIGSGKLSDFWAFNFYTNSWGKTFHVENARYGAVGLSIGSTGYIMTGNFWFEPKKDVWAFDAINNTWSQKADFTGEPRTSAVGFTIGEKAFIGTGSGGVYGQIHLNDFWEYDPQKNTWTRKADYPGISRNNGVGFCLGNKGYIGLGLSDPGVDNHLPKELWEYDPSTDKWSRKTDLPFEGRYGASAFTIDGKAYVGLGTASSGYKKDLWEYNNVYDSWTRKADFEGVARANAVSFAIGLNGFMGAGNSDYTGDDNTYAKKDFWQYKQATDSWMSVTDFPAGGRISASSFVIGNNAFVGFGTNFEGAFWPERVKSDLWKYTPSNQPPIAAGFVMLNYYPDAHLLNAWGSYDPEGGPIKFSWKKVAGPDQYKMLYENASTPVISNLVTGTYTFQITITDEEGLTASKEVTFSVKVNQPPVANGFVMMYYYPNAHLLNAWGSYDPEGGPIKFWWTKIAGPAQYNMLYPEASTPVISNLVVGTYSFQLRVTDSAGATAYDTVDIINTTALSASNNNYRIVNERDLHALIKNKLIIAPNPANDRLNVRWSSDYSGSARLTVMDMSGKTVMINDIEKQGAEFSSRLSVSSLKPGNYYLFIRMQNGTSLSTKFIKH